MTLIFMVSSIPSFPRTQLLWWDYALKKSAHMVEFAILFYLVYRALENHPRRILLTWIISVGFAISDELHQSFVPGRFAKATDVGFDTLGILIMHVALQSCLPWKSLKRPVRIL
jgi:VanZ family protein